MTCCHLQQLLKCTCLQLSSLREIHIDMLQLFVPFFLSSFAVGNTLWQNILKWKQSPLNSPRRVHENRRPKMLTLWMWHMGDVFRARGRGGVGRKMETPVFIPLGTLNLLDSILPTGSSKTDLVTLLAVHTCTLQVPGCISACSLWLKCWSVTVFAGHLLQTVPLKDVDIAGMLEGLLVSSLVLANTFRGTWISLGIDGLEW